MTDRQPGAPGQYKFTVDPSVAQNILIGETVPVTIVRDDQPVVEGTPYNKAAVLPDELAQRVCPQVPDPTPADAYRGLLGNAAQIILPSGSWTNNMQRVAVSGVTETNNIFPAPDPEDENYMEYHACGIRCVAQSVGYLTFKCDDVPGMDVAVNVLVRP